MSNINKVPLSSAIVTGDPETLRANMLYGTTVFSLKHKGERSWYKSDIAVNTFKKMIKGRTIYVQMITKNWITITRKSAITLYTSYEHDLGITLTLSTKLYSNGYCTISVNPK